MATTQMSSPEDEKKQGTISMNDFYGYLKDKGETQDYADVNAFSQAMQDKDTAQHFNDAYNTHKRRDFVDDPNNGIKPFYDYLTQKGETKNYNDVYSFYDALSDENVMKDMNQRYNDHRKQDYINSTPNDGSMSFKQYYDYMKNHSGDTWAYNTPEEFYDELQNEQSRKHYDERFQAYQQGDNDLRQQKWQEGRKSYSLASQQDMERRAKEMGAQGYDKDKGFMFQLYNKETQRAASKVTNTDTGVSVAPVIWDRTGEGKEFYDDFGNRVSAPQRLTFEEQAAFDANTITAVAADIYKTKGAEAARKYVDDYLAKHEMNYVGVANATNEAAAKKGSSAKVTADDIKKAYHDTVWANVLDNPVITAMALPTTVNAEREEYNKVAQEQIDRWKGYGVGYNERRTDDLMCMKAADFFMSRSQSTAERAEQEGENDRSAWGLVKSAGRGLWDGVSGMEKWDFGLTDVQRAQTIRDAFTAYAAGKATREQQLLIRTYGTYSIAQSALAKNNSQTYRMFNTTGESIPFMLQMLASPELKMTDGATKGALKWLTQKYGASRVASYINRISSAAAKSKFARIATDLWGKLPTSMVEKGIAKVAPYAKSVANGAAHLADSAAGGAYQTLKFNMGNVAAEAYDRANGNVKMERGTNGTYEVSGLDGFKQIGSVGSDGKVIKNEDDMLKEWARDWTLSFGDYTVQNGSELIGEYLAPFVKATGGAIGKLTGINKLKNIYGIRNVMSFLDDVAATDTMKKLKVFQHMTHYDGNIGEYSEEVVGNIANALLGIDGNFNLDPDDEDSIFNYQKNLDTYLGVAVMGTLFQALGTGAYIHQGWKQHQANEVLANANADGVGAFGNDAWQKIKRTIDDMDGDFSNVGRMIADNKKNGGTDLQEKAVLKYVAAKAKVMSFQKIDDAILNDEDTDPNTVVAKQAYDAGYSITDQKQMNAAKHEYESVGTELAEAMGLDEDADVSQAIGLNADASNAADVLQIISQNADMTDEQKDLVTDYIKARLKWQGMIENAKHGITEQVAASNKEIDSNTNEKGQIQHATTKENQDVIVLRGNVQTDENNNVVPSTSDATLIVKNTYTGRMEMIPASDLLTLSAPQSAEEVKKQSEQQIRQTIGQQRAQAINGTLAFNVGDLYEVDDAEGNTTKVQILQDNGDGTVMANVNGEQQRLYKDDIQKGAEDNAMKQLDEYRASQKEYRASMGQESATPESTIPVDENGKKQYEQAPVDDTFDSLQAELGTEGAVEVADYQKRKAEQALKEAQAMPTDAEDISDQIQQMKAKKAAIEKAQQKVNYWNNVANTPRERAAAEQKERERVERIHQKQAQNRRTYAQQKAKAQAEKQSARQAESQPAAQQAATAQPAQTHVGRRGNTVSQNAGVLDASNMDLQHKAPKLMKFAESVGKALGQRIIFVPKSSQWNGKNVNGNIYVAMNADEITPEETSKTMQDVIAAALGHEISHTLFDNVDMRNAFVPLVKKYLGKKYDRLFNEQFQTYQMLYIAGVIKEPITADYIDEEIACNMAGQLLQDPEFMDMVINNETPAKQGLLQTIAQCIDNVLQKIGMHLPMTDRARLEQMRDAWLNAFQQTQAINNGTAEPAQTATEKETAENANETTGTPDVVETEGEAELTQRTAQQYKQQEVNDMMEGKAGTVFNENGDLVAENTDGITKFSIKTWEEGGRDALASYLDGQVADKKVTREEADNMLAEMDRLTAGAKDVAKGKPNSLFGQWSYEVVRMKDGTKVPVMHALKKNSEYELNIDFSTVCKKRQVIDHLFNKMINEGYLQHETLSSVDIARMNQIIQKHGLEIACGICFVDSRRYNAYTFADGFLEKFNPIVQSLMPDAEVAGFNYANDSKFTNEGKEDLTQVDEVVDWSEVFGLDKNHPAALKKYDLDWNYTYEILKPIYDKAREFMKDKAKFQDKFESYWRNQNKDALIEFIQAEYAKKGKKIAKKNIKADDLKKFMPKAVKAGIIPKATKEDMFDYAVKTQNANANAEQKFAMAISQKPNLRKVAKAEDFIASEGWVNVVQSNGDLETLWNIQKGAAGARPNESNVQYQNDVLNKDVTGDIFDIGGYRMQSFSDFIGRMYFDYMQAFADLAAKALPAHAYTKEPSFVKLFGMMGIKINMSLVSQVDSSLPKEYAGLTRDAEGNLTYNFHTTIKDADGNIIQQGQTFPPEEAFALQEDPRFTKNVGTIAVGLSREHIRMLLRDPRIRMVIPYHKSGLPHGVATVYNINEINDYTNQQNTIIPNAASSNDAKAKRKDVDQYNFILHQLSIAEDKKAAYTALYDLLLNNNVGGMKDMHKEYEKRYQKAVKGDLVIKETADFVPSTKHGDAGFLPKAAADIYLAACRTPKRNYIPRFGEFSSKYDYYKVLEDFAVYDSTGEYTPQEVVKFHVPDNVDEYIKETLQEDEDINAKELAETDGIVQEIENYLDNKELREKQDAIAEKEAKNVTDEERAFLQTNIYNVGDPRVGGDAKLSAKVNTDQTTTPEFKDWFGDSKVVDENGKPKVVWHGSPTAGFYTFDNSNGAIWAAENPEYAQRYTGDRDVNVEGVQGSKYPLYMSIQNPIEVGSVEEPCLESKEYFDMCEKLGEDPYELAKRCQPEMWERNMADMKETGLDGQDAEDGALLSFPMWAITRSKPFADLLKSKGYDGIIATEGYGHNRTYAVLDPTQIKSATANNGDFDANNPDIRYSAKVAASDPFYSNAAKAVEGIKQNKATGDQWLAMIKKAGGLKAEEDKWMGLSDWLAGKKSVTKEEVEQFIADNAIKVEDVNYSDEARAGFDVFAKHPEAQAKFDEIQAYHKQVLAEQKAKIGDIWKAYVNAADIVSEKYGAGFDSAFENVDDDGNLRIKARMEQQALEVLGVNVDNPIDATRMKYTTEGLENNHEIALTVPTVEPYTTGNMPEVHFADKFTGGKAVAWVRFGDAKDTDGNRVLVVDEVQSQRHQDARKVGYKTKEQEAEMERLLAERKDIEKRIEENDRKGVRDYNLYNELRANNVKIEALKNTQGIPDAPFQRTWQEIGMKRVLRYAAENGYDKVAWTTGAQQSERYNMSKVLNRIGRADEPDMRGRQIYLHLTSGNPIAINVDDEGKIIDGEYQGKSIASIVDKELADKAMSLKDNSFYNLDKNAQIANSGMEGFYDGILVKFMDKYGKKWGVKTHDITLDLPRPEDQVMHAVDVTDEMRDSVMQGQAMFSAKAKYGVPYAGSKTKLADDILSHLPAGKRFVDLFTGGAAMSHAAAVSGKYDAVHMNDIRPIGIQLFMDGMDGKYNDYNKTYDKETFKDIKGTPESLIHSFMSNGRSYQGDRVQSRVNRVNAIQNIKDKRDMFTTSAQDYRDVEIKDGDVLYADIPYRDTDNSAYSKGGTQFDYDAFEDWANNLEHPVYVSTGAPADKAAYIPKGFTPIWSKDINSGKNGVRKEVLCVQDKYATNGARYSAKVDSMLDKHNNYRYTDTPAAYNPKELSREGSAHMELYTDPRLTEARKVIKNLSVELGGHPSDASNGAFQSEEGVTGLADSKKAEQIGTKMVDALNKYRDALVTVLANGSQTAARQNVFSDAIGDVDDAIKWYDEFAKGMHNKLGDHDEDGIRYSLKGINNDTVAKMTEGENKKLEEEANAYRDELMGRYKGVEYWQKENFKNLLDWYKKEVDTIAEKQGDIDWLNARRSTHEKEIKNKQRALKTAVNKADKSEYKWDAMKQYNNAFWNAAIIYFDQKALDVIEKTLGDNAADNIHRNLMEELGVNNRTTYTVHDLRSWFDKFNEDEENAKLFDMIMPALEKMGTGIKVKWNAPKKGSWVGQYSSTTMELNLRPSAFKDAANPQQLCKTMLHECIHAVTSYATHIVELQPSYKYRSYINDNILNNKENLPQGLKNAVQDLHNAYHQLSYKHTISDMYGASSMDEMIAELANPEFREELKKLSLWEKVIDAITRIINHFREEGNETNAYEALKRNLERFVDNYDGRSVYAESQVNTSMPESYNGQFDKGDEQEVRYSTKAHAANMTAQSLNLPADVIWNETDIPEGINKDTKGWVDADGKVHVVLPNCTSDNDVKATVLHEAVGRYGLRKVMGDENYNKFIRDLYMDNDDIRKEVGKYLPYNNWDYVKATEQYCASFAEKDDIDMPLWKQVKSAFLNALRHMGVNVRLTDEDVQYMLWKAKNALQGGDFFDRANDISKQMDLGVGNYARYSAKKPAQFLQDSARMQYDRMAASKYIAGREAWQDSMITLREMQNILAQTSGSPITGWENAYLAENRMHGTCKNEAEWYDQNFYVPMLKAVGELMKRHPQKITMSEVNDYLIAKHGLERNLFFAFRNALDEVEQNVYQRELSRNLAALDPTSPTYEKDKKKADRDAKNAAHTYRNNVYDNFQNDADLIDIKDQYQHGQITSYDDYLGKVQDRMEAYVGGLDVKDMSGLTELTGSKDDFETEAFNIVANMEMPEVYDEVWNMWDKINAATKETLKKSRESGRMTKQAYDYVNGMFDFYVPLRGWEDTTADEVYTYRTSGRGAFNPSVKKMKGRKSQAESPLAYIGNMAVSEITLGNQNLVKQYFLRMVQNHPSTLATVSETWYQNIGTDTNPKWVVRTPDITENMTADEISDEIDRFKQEMEQLRANGEATNDKGSLNLQYPIVDNEKTEHKVKVMVDGKEYTIFINGDPKVAQAINGTNTVSNTLGDGVINKWVIGTVKKLNRFVAEKLTSQNPAFVFSNLCRDMLAAQTQIFMKESPAYIAQFEKNVATILRPRMYKGMPTGAMPMLLRKWESGRLDTSVPLERYFDEFMRNGGETGFVAMLAVDDFKKDIQKKLNKFTGHTTAISNAWDAFTDTIEFYNRAVEDVTRFTTYMTSRMTGKSLEDAIFDAKNISLNFDKSGSGDMLNRAARDFYIFINPAIQALQNMVHLIKEHPVRFSAVAATYITRGAFQPVINEFMINLFGDDDDKDTYWSLPERVRRNNLIFFIPFTHEFFTLPLSQEYRVWHSLGETMNSVMTGHSNENTMVEFLTSLMDLVPLNPFGNEGNVVLTFTPQFAKPFMDVHENQTFSGFPVYKDADSYKYEPEFQTASYGTPSWMIKTSKYLNYLGGGNEHRKGAIEKFTRGFGEVGELSTNPSVWNHLLNGYFGGVYNFLAQIGGTATDVVEYASGGEHPKLNGVPIVSRFLARPLDKDDTGKLQQGDWDMFDQADETQSEFSHWKADRKGHKEGAEEGLNRIAHDPAYKEAMKVEKYRTIIDRLRKQIKDTDDEDRKAQLSEKLQTVLEKFRDKFGDSELEATDE